MWVKPTIQPTKEPTTFHFSTRQRRGPLFQILKFESSSFSPPSIHMLSSPTSTLCAVAAPPPPLVGCPPSCPPLGHPLLLLPSPSPPHRFLLLLLPLHAYSSYPPFSVPVPAPPPPTLPAFYHFPLLLPIARSLSSFPDLHQGPPIFVKGSVTSHGTTWGYLQ